MSGLGSPECEVLVICNRGTPLRDYLRKRCSPADRAIQPRNRSPEPGPEESGKSSQDEFAPCRQTHESNRTEEQRNNSFYPRPSLRGERRSTSELNRSFQNRLGKVEPLVCWLLSANGAQQTHLQGRTYGQGESGKARGDTAAEQGRVGRRLRAGRRGSRAGRRAAPPTSRLRTGLM